MLAYGPSKDSIDEYVRMRGSAISQILRHFARGLIAAFGNIYLRHHTAEDMLRILAVWEKRGFPGMLGSIDFCKWMWIKCPSRGTDKILGPYFA